jgi:hypothetical protein
MYDTQNLWFYVQTLPTVRNSELMLALSMGSNRVGVCLRSPKDGNRSFFRNVVLYNYFEFRTIDKAHKPSYSGDSYLRRHVQLHQLLQKMKHWLQW